MTDAVAEPEASNSRPSGPRPPGAASPNYMSYSRMNSILTCGHQFYLERILKVPSNESWASVGGNAFHSSVEQMLLASLSTE